MFDQRFSRVSILVLPRACRRKKKFSKIVFSPITSKHQWHTFDGMMQRFAFAFSMGLAAVALNAMLWVVSLPWMTWKFVSWVLSKVRASHRNLVLH